MHGHMDNVLTKQQWYEALAKPQYGWSSRGEGQTWLYQMLKHRTPELPDEHEFDDVTDFLRLLDTLAERYASSDGRRSRAIFSEWLRDPAGDAIGMAHDLSYICGYIGGLDLGISVGAHTLGGWYQLCARVEDFLRVCYLPLVPFVMESDSPTLTAQLGAVSVSANLLFGGRTHVIISRKDENTAKSVRLHVVGSSFAETIDQLGLHTAEALTLGAALGVLDEAIAFMEVAPNDPDSLRGMLEEGRLSVAGVITHAWYNARILTDASFFIC